MEVGWQSPIYRDFELASTGDKVNVVLGGYCVGVTFCGVMFLLGVVLSTNRGVNSRYKRQYYYVYALGFRRIIPVKFIQGIVKIINSMRGQKQKTF